MLDVKIYETKEEAEQVVAHILLDEVTKQMPFVIGFATGNTPQGVYRHLIESYQKGEVDFSNVIAFNLDEYVHLPMEHPCSFASAMKTSLFDHINIPSKQIFALHGDAEDMEAECYAYEELIAKYPVDIQLLGIGMDGHIAYNEPMTHFTSRTHVVDLHKESIESSLDYGFSHIEDVPTQGVTQGIATIMQAKKLIMMATGKKKAELVKRMLEDNVEEAFPSSIIQRHENVIVVLDQESASCLKKGASYGH